MAFTPINIGSNETPGFTPITPDMMASALATATQTHDNLLRQAQQRQQQAQQKSEQANSLAGIAKETAKGTVGTLANTGLKFLQSAVKAPGDIISGLMGKGPDTSTLPNFTGEGQKTFQGEMQSQIVPDVTSGKESPLAGTVEAVGGVVGGGLDVLTAGEAGGAIKEGAGKLAEKTGVSEFLAKNADKKATQTAVKALTPKMTAGEVEKAGAAGKATVSKLTGAKLNMTKDKGFMSIVDDVKGLVKGKSAIEDVNSVRSALSTEASALRDKVMRSGKDIIYPFKELASKISSAEEPLSLKGTPFEKQIAPLKNAVMQMAQKAGGKVSSLLDVRQEFDALVNKTWPNLFDSENAPMRGAVTAVRDTLNTFIKDNLPKEVGYMESLGKQTNFYRAIDNLATKIPEELKNTKGVLGKAKEAGKKGLGLGAKAVGLGALYEGSKKLGVPLP